MHVALGALYLIIVELRLHESFVGGVFILAGRDVDVVVAVESGLLGEQQK